jgi:hypothetical protein
VTGDISRYTKAAVFQPGAQTEVVLRFSTVADLFLSVHDIGLVASPGVHTNAAIRQNRAAC